jgi:hypothetical protein
MLKGGGGGRREDNEEGRNGEDGGRGRRESEDRWDSTRRREVMDWCDEEEDNAGRIGNSGKGPGKRGR